MRTNAAWQAFDRAVKAAQEAYWKAFEPTQVPYNEAIKAAWRSNKVKTAAGWAAFKKALKTDRERHRKATLCAWDAYQAAIRAASEAYDRAMR